MTRSRIASRCGRLRLGPFGNLGIAHVLQVLVLIRDLDTPVRVANRPLRSLRRAGLRAQRCDDSDGKNGISQMTHAVLLHETWRP
jgi:hypothetical protein